MDIVNEFQKKNMKKAKLPKIWPGYTIRVHQKIKEAGRERIQVYEGLVIATSGNKFRPMIMVRRVVGGIGVERIFRLNAPNIIKIEITKKENVRRAKLYYVRRREQQTKVREDKEGLKRVQEELRKVQESASAKASTSAEATADKTADKEEKTKKEKETPKTEEKKSAFAEAPASALRASAGKSAGKEEKTEKKKEESTKETKKEELKS